MFTHRAHSPGSGCTESESSSKPVVCWQTDYKHITRRNHHHHVVVALANFHGVNISTVAHFKLFTWCQWDTKFLKTEYFHQLLLWCQQFILVPIYQIKPYPIVEPWGCQIPVQRKWLITHFYTAEAETDYILCWHPYSCEDQEMACLLGGNGSFKMFQKTEEENNIKADIGNLIHGISLPSSSK